MTTKIVLDASTCVNKKCSVSTFLRMRRCEEKKVLAARFTSSSGSGHRQNCCFTVEFTAYNNLRDRYVAPSASGVANNTQCTSSRQPGEPGVLYRDDTGKAGAVPRDSDVKLIALRPKPMLEYL